MVDEIRASAPTFPGIRSPDRRKRRVLIIVLVLVAIALVGWLAWTLAHQKAGPGGPGGFGGGRRPQTTVGVATAALADIPVTIDALGTVTPAATVTVRPQVSGVITQVLFREGQMVTRGQALAIIDPRPLDMALMQAQGQLQRDQAQLSSAQVTLVRFKTLLAQDSIARQEVDTQAALVQQLEGTVKTDRAAVGTAQLNLGYSRVIAPVGGRVGLRAIDVGNYIGAGDSTGLVTLTEINPIDVQFTVPQDVAPRIQDRASKETLTVTALDRTRTITLGQGTFSTLDNQVDTTTGTVKAKARFTNDKGALFPNQFVNVRLSLDTIKGAVVVPVTAVRTGANGDFVWLLGADKTVSQRKVTRGEATVDKVQIASGLKVGEKVITEGGDRLTEGSPVTLAGDKPAAPGAAGERRRNRGGAARPGGAQGGQRGGQQGGGGGGGPPA